jgi:hypothetical protein
MPAFGSDVTHVQGGGDQMQITEAHFRDASGRLAGAPYEYTGLAHALPNVNDADFSNGDQSNFNGVFAGVKIAWDFGAVREVTSLALGQSDSPDRFPDDFRVQASHDGVTWHDAAVIAGWRPGNSIGPKHFEW